MHVGHTEELRWAQYIMDVLKIWDYCNSGKKGGADMRGIQEIKLTVMFKGLDLGMYVDFYFSSEWEE